MSKTFFIAAATATALLSTSVFAVSTPSTDEFIKKASMSDLFEVESSKVALSHAKDPQVISFAQQMIDDHIKSSEELRTAAQTANLPNGLISTSLDDTHKAKLDDLSDKKGEDFDEKYVEMQEDAHEKGVKLFENYADSGDNPELKNFAAKTLPTLKQHAEHVKELDK